MTFPVQLSVEVQYPTGNGDEMRKIARMRRSVDLPATPVPDVIVVRFGAKSLTVQVHPLIWDVKKSHYEITLPVETVGYEESARLQTYPEWQWSEFK